MTIHDYIEKHQLRLVAKWPTTDQQFAELLIEPTGDVFEIYRNPSADHFVSLNLVKGKFRIYLDELVPVISDWCSTDQNYGNDEPS